LGYFYVFVQIYMTSGVASPKIWEGPKNFGGVEMFDFRRIILFCLEKTPLKAQNDNVFQKFGGNGPFDLPGYAYVHGIYIS